MPLSMSTAIIPPVSRGVGPSSLYPKFFGIFLDITLLEVEVLPAEAVTRLPPVLRLLEPPAATPPAVLMEPKLIPAPFASAFNLRSLPISLSTLFTAFFVSNLTVYVLALSFVRLFCRLLIDVLSFRNGRIAWSSFFVACVKLLMAVTASCDNTFMS